MGEYSTGMEYLTGAFNLYFAGVSLFLDPVVIGFLLLGGLIGVVFGALPGLTSTMSLAVFTPLTFGMDDRLAFVFLIAIYNLAVYGGSISAILINIPGTPGAIATGLDGYPMAQRGEAGRAIGLAAMVSCFGGLFGMVVLVLGAPMLARIALQLHSSEYALLAMLGLTLIAFVAAKSMVKGIIAGAIGLALMVVGMDPHTGFQRFTFGIPELDTGLANVPVMIGIFGIAEVLKQIDKGMTKTVISQKISSLLSGFSELKRLIVHILRSSVIGTIIGAIPGTGGGIAAITSYGILKRLYKHPERLGTGDPVGVATAESANNAAVGGALMPSLTLGIPGDAMNAILLAALMFHGLRPGPLLFSGRPDFVSTIFISLTLSSLLILFYGLVLARQFAKVLTVPKQILLPVILILSIVGSYAMNYSLFDVWVAVIFGFVGFFLQKAGIPPAPMAIGLILGPLLEDNLRRTLLLSEGSISPFFTRPISVILLVIIFVILFGPAIYSRLRSLIRWKNK